MDQLDSLKSLILQFSQHLVDRPDEVKIEALENGSAVTFRLSVGPGEVGKIIGKQGRTARSLRTIISAVSMKMKRRVSIDIVEM